ncbi:peptidoglycan recognition protein family protein [Streptomyces sp. 4N509B]|uniref:peptidoglycan recognition protein family protein n=1 Tax=Streptomyces sp. 4N509B TaxID=3457413 RepID=UPI003FD3916C
MTRTTLGACAVALTVPLFVPLGAAAEPAAGPASAPVAVEAVDAVAAVDASDASSDTAATTAAAAAVQSFALTPTASTETATAAAWTAGGAAAPAGSLTLPATRTEPFSLLGVVWTNPEATLDGVVEVRTRARKSGTWSRWRTLPTTAEHAPDENTAESGDPDLRGGTTPLWVGESDGVEVRVTTPDGETTVGLPEGMRLELVDPNEAEAADGEAVVEVVEPELPEAELPTVDSAPTAGDHVGPRPPIVTRSGWGADESLRESGFVYTDRVRTAFVHHTAGSNSYTCKNAPAVIRSIYVYHTQSLGWRDVGYNFFVDRCGTIYEGRAGGVIEPVMGAHTYGHNHNSMGVAVLGTYSDTKPSKRAIEGVAKITAWKLGLYDVNPSRSQVRISGGGKWPAGTEVRLDNISGHRDGYATECPGKRLYDALPAIRDLATRLQGRKG